MKRYVRNGIYTKRLSKWQRLKAWFKRVWHWFKRRTWWQKTIILASPFLAFLLVVPLITYLYYAHDISNVERLMNRNNTGIVLMDKNGQTFYSTGRAEHHALVPLSQISKPMQQALLASEDKDFYKHGAFSVWSTLRALYTNIITRDATGYGGSTITQQLAKNTLLTNQQTVLRKYQELVLSVAIENRYSKDDILAMYLNSVWYGGNAFGIEEAAQDYFGKAPKDLTLAESAMLVGVLPAPSAYSPTYGDQKLAKERQQEVLRRMVKASLISQADATAAYSQTLTYQPVQTINNAAPHFTEMVLRELYNKYGEEKVNRSGYQVKTSLDLSLQNQANSNVANQVKYIQNMGGSNAGLVAIDPTSGEIRALVGSVDYNNPDWGKVNMATTARQPGSSFKPVFYSAAMSEGLITPATVIKDEPINIGGYSPHNATRRNYGNVTVREALDWSLNIPAVKVMQMYGVSNAVATAKKVGITTLNKNPSQYGLSLAIGSAEMKLEEVTNAYAGFANMGEQYPTTTIHSISDKFNKTIYTNKNQSKEILDRPTAWLLSNILSDNKTRAFMFGSTLNVPGKTVAVKTGTTDDNRDAWAVGYTPNIAIGVWVGNNNNDVMVSGGADMAGPIWRKTMLNAIGSATPSFGDPPSGITQQKVCLSLSNASGSYTEYFLTAHTPNSSCSSNTSSSNSQKQTETPSSTSTTEPQTTTGSGSGDGDTDTTPTTNGSSTTDTNTSGTGTSTGSGTGNNTGTGTGTNTGTGTTNPGGTGSGGSNGSNSTGAGTGSGSGSSAGN